MTPHPTADVLAPPPTDHVTAVGLEAIARRVLWLSSLIVHCANHERPTSDGLKVGGHQASSASSVSLITALWFGHLRGGDRVAVKPHASPVFYAIQYLLGRLEEEDLTRLRAFGGLQSYPSRAKNPDIVDFSTGSVGLGAASVNYQALVSHYLAGRTSSGPTDRSFWAIVGDAELDEGNVWETVTEPLLDDIPGIRWIVDLNRQSLDRVVPGIRVQRLRSMFAANGWRVIDVKYGAAIQHLFRLPGGDQLRDRLDEMPNEEYQAMIGGPIAECRERLLAGCSGETAAQAAALVDDLDDTSLFDVLRALGGHDQTALLGAYQQADAEPSPAVVFAYTVKGWGLPFAGDRLNHAALLSPDQMAVLAQRLGAPEDRFARLADGEPGWQLVESARRRLGVEPTTTPHARVDVPNEIGRPPKRHVSSQEAAGRLLVELTREAPEISDRIVTTSPDVAVSTNLAGWINRVGVWSPKPEPARDAEASMLRWNPSPHGQHLELGIAEMNLFLLLGQLGVATEQLGETLVPIGTVYDPFVCRGLDAFIYALYNGGRFVLLGTPSGVTLAPEGGAHQSTVTSSLAIELPQIDAYEPCFAQEVEWLLLEAIRSVVERRRSAYLRLSTRPIDQDLLRLPADPAEREAMRTRAVSGMHRVRDARTFPGYKPTTSVLLFAVGAVVPEAIQAAASLADEGIFASVFSLTSPGKIYAAWQGTTTAALETARHQPDLFSTLDPVERGRPAVTVIDGHPHALSFIGTALRVRSANLGVVGFGQSGTIEDLYRHHHLDADSIVSAAISLL